MECTFAIQPWWAVWAWLHMNPARLLYSVLWSTDGGLGRSQYAAETFILWPLYLFSRRRKTLLPQRNQLHTSYHLLNISSTVVSFTVSNSAWIITLLIWGELFAPHNLHSSTCSGFKANHEIPTALCNLNSVCSGQMTRTPTEIYYSVDEELCPNSATEVLCDGLQIALMIGNLCADI